MGLESGQSWNVVVASYSIDLSAAHDVKKQKDQLTTICGIKWKCKGSVQAADTEKA